MADFEINNPVTFTKNVRKFEMKDKGHADVFNRVTAALVNNDAYLEENKVDKEKGKGLSENNYTNADKKKLDGIEDYIETKVSEHNTSEAAHADIRELIINLANRLNVLADSDDTTLDQLSEIVTYIKSNRSLIENVTTKKVNVDDIIDSLNSSTINKPLSAKQGKVLKDLIDTLTSTVEGKVNKAGDTMTGDLIVPNTRPNTFNPTLPVSGSLVLPDLMNLRDYRGFLGTYSKDGNSNWNYLISIRHRNGFGDGNLYGMYIKALLSSNDKNLSWGFQSIEEWSKERTILDSYNYKKFCTPDNIGALPKSGGYMDSTGYIGFNEENYSDGGGIQKSIVDKLGIYIESVDYEEDSAENLEEYNKVSIEVTAKGIKITNHSKNQYLDIDYNTIQSDKSVFVSPQQTARPFEFAYEYFARNGDDGKTSLGTSSMRWKELYAVNGTIQTLDRTKKKNVNNLDMQKMKLFINGLIPCSYEMVDGTSGRTHWGFIAQDIEKLMKKLCMDSKDFAGFIKSPKKVIKYVECKDKNGNKFRKPIEQVIAGEYDYALRYDEFIAPLIAVVQEQQKTIDKQQEEIEKLKKEMNELKEIVFKIYN